MCESHRCHREPPAPVFEPCEPRTLFSASPAGYNGFTVSGNQVFDSADQPFVIRGFNHTMFWGNSNQNLQAISTFEETGANAIRLVFTSDPNNTWSASDTWAERKAAIDAVLAENLVPIIEFHDATGDEPVSDLNKIVDQWVADAANLQQYEERIIINIANEWGPKNNNRVINGKSAEQYWADAYASAIQRIRNAGLDSLLIVDAGTWAQSTSYIRERGQQVLNSDPHRNVLFSLHMYRMWYDPGTVQTDYNASWPRYDIRTELNHIKTNLNLPVYIGEFSWQESSDVQANDGSGNTYTTRTLMQVAEDLDIGWTAWSWNENGDTQLDMLKDGQWLYQNDSNLTTFGNLIINDSAYGLKATAEKPAGFGNGSGGGSGGGNTPTTTTYQAENRTSGSNVTTQAGGGSDGGYADYNGVGAYVEWNNVAGNGNQATLKLRYANGSNANRTSKLYVNNNLVDTVYFGSTGGWTVWRDVSRTVNLNDGNNTVRLVADPSAGPNLDKLTVTLTGTIGGGSGGSTNLVTNGDFTSGTNNWNLNVNTGSGAAGSFSVGGTTGMSGNALRANITDGTNISWPISAIQDLSLQAGQSYRLTFKAKAQSNRSLNFAVQQKGGNWTTYAGGNRNLTTSVQTFTVDFTAGFANSQLRFNFGGSNADVWLDDVAITLV